MKKLPLALITILCTTLLSGCGRESVVGSDAAKLLLAEERLDSDTLKDSKISFDYSSNARRKNNINLNKTNVRNDVKRKNKTGVDSSKEGNTITWNTFKEYSNTISYFDSFINNIDKQTDGAGELIDQAKKKVDSNNVWVKTVFYDLLLQVDANSDKVMRRNKSAYNIVNRYFDDQGIEHYDVFNGSDGGKYGTKVSKIGDYRYEYSYVTDDMEFEHYFIADKSRGYWLVQNPVNDRELSTTIIKDDKCYDFTTRIDSNTFSSIAVISPDRNCDILRVNGNNFRFYAGAFGNLQSLSINVQDNEIVDFSQYDYSNSQDAKIIYDSEEKKYFTISTEDLNVNFENGRTIKANDTFIEGNVVYDGTVISYSADGLIPTITFTIKGDTIEERLNHLKAFINEIGITFVRDTNSIYETIKSSYNDAMASTVASTWNNINLDSEENYLKAYEIERDKLSVFVDEYNKVKDNTTLSRYQQGKLDRKTAFPYITNSSFDSSYENGIVNIKSARARVDDLKLFEANKKYNLQFALAQYNEENEGYFNLVPINVNNDSFNLYSGGNQFEVQANNLTFPIGVPGDGNYELVTYIADEEGIRVTRPQPIAFSDVVSNEISIHNFTANIFKTEEGFLGINSVINDNVVLVIEDKKESYNYQELYNLLASEAFKYGVVSDNNIETLTSNNSWEILNSSEENLTSGTYRLKFINDDDKEVYVYTTY